MQPLTLRPYRGDDEAALLRLWNQALTHDPLDAPTFRTRVLLDPNFQPQGLLLAESGAELLGFVLALTRQVPLFLQGLEPERAWITAFGVHPAHRRQGLGRRLFAAALERLQPRTVSIAPYTPNYFIPGVDRDAYPAALAFLQAGGWQVVSSPISMRAELTGFSIPPEILALEDSLARQHGITVSPVAAADLPELMPFIARHFSWDWYRFSQELLLQLFGAGSDEICFLVARQRGQIVGYCQQRRERFGPFGVAPELRRLGIGRLLLFRCLASMLAKGFHCAWFLWTGENAARLYALAGFHTVRRFAVLEIQAGAVDFASGKRDIGVVKGGEATLHNPLPAAGKDPEPSAPDFASGERDIGVVKGGEATLHNPLPAAGGDSEAGAPDFASGKSHIEGVKRDEVTFHSSNPLVPGKLMVIGAHAGDAENMAGAVVLKHTRLGQAAVILHLTLGEAGHPSLPPAVYALQRQEEVQASARLMGARALWLPYPDGQLPESEELKLQVCDLIRQEKPDVILTHWKGSLHKDHRAAHAILQDALFYAGLPSLERSAPAHRVRGVYYPENWEDMEGWRADIYLDASDVWDDYLAMLRTHALMRGGVSTFRYYDYYDALGTLRGCLGGFPKAVGLMAPGAGLRRLSYLPGLEPGEMINLT